MISRTLTSALAIAALGVGGTALSHPADGSLAHHPHPHGHYSWDITPTGSNEEFRGLAAVSRSTAWVSGQAGTVLRTTNSGRTWTNVSPPQAAGLQLRDIEAFGSQRAVALSIGTGEASRIYSTTNGGASWTEVFRNTDPNAFYDCIAFGSHGSGLALSDPVNGHFQLARTYDFGASWSVANDVEMPAAMAGEFAFAASGTCIVSGPGRSFWFATGGIDEPRVFRSTDGGHRWTASTTAFRGGPSAGIYSLDFRDPRHGVAVGGDFNAERDGSDAAGQSRDGGKRWTTSDAMGYRSGVAFLPHTSRTVIAVGPSGSDVSTDGGATWTTFDDDRYDGIQCASDGACWASGTNGRVAQLDR